ncbi:hypothetical protein [uncultured Cellulomonas sp.]|uniref:hypothetical protein n=1 Tax=uncultured Cellulomonas sp. TaxID=189682 RepID=UPI0028E94B11|nr:hypothetical protein [uncultured Cellulomonas sp.]
MRRALATIVTIVALAGCSTPPEPLPPAPTASRAPAPTVVQTTFALYTHCGIRELTYAGAWYERQGGTLDDGSGNPPAGWGNPTHEGLLTVTGDVAVFTDLDGHEEHFDLRPGADEPLQVCD